MLAAAGRHFEIISFDFRLEHSPSEKKYLLETMAGGVAVFDYDNDGLLDLFFVNGAPVPSLVRGSARWWNRLYRQLPHHAFADLSENSGLSQAGQRIFGMGVATGDYDNDGCVDLYVTGYPRNTLFHNNGDGTFTDVTARAGTAAAGWSASAVFLDYDNDGQLDLFITRYLDWDLDRHHACGGNTPTYCNPDQFGPVSNLLFRNRGDGTFEDVSERSGIAAAKGKALGAAVADYDDDGWIDIFVANDGLAQFLFRNNGDGTFTERAVEAGVALADDGKAFAGMGVDWGDYDRDGRVDVLITNLAMDMYALYRNEGHGTFRYTTLATGLAALTMPHSGWGFRWFDFDNDGWLDLFVAQGHVLDNIDRIAPGRRYLEPPALIRNRGGRFERMPINGYAAMAGRGAAFGDFDNDGRVDVVMTALGMRPLLLRNVAVGGHWMTLALSSTRSNRDAIGARVRVITADGIQTAFVTTGGSYLSASDKRVHFGLGAATHAQVEIRWPGGQVQRLTQLAADRVHCIVEPR